MLKIIHRNLIIVIAIVFLSICNGREQSSSMQFKTMEEKSSTSHDNVKPIEIYKLKRSNKKSSIYNVKKYGAKGDGTADDTKAFEAAWEDACHVQGSTMLVPSHYVFLVNPTTFFGTKCASDITFQVEGKIIAPQNEKSWASNPQAWLTFRDIKTITLRGNGTLDGQGSVWWKKDKLPVKAKPHLLLFARCSDVAVTGVTIQNSPLKHLRIEHCDRVEIFQINIASPADSPNTDGINLSMARNVKIHHVTLACGDDCISILGGCSNILMYHVNCDPGHGISIGSLGKGNTQSFVSNITVRDSVIANALTGIRIKTWQGGSGSVNRVNFRNIQLSGVQTAISIDQYYCDKSEPVGCKNQTSAVAVSRINYANITGTYILEPVHFACSDSTPCKGLTLSGIDLEPVRGNYNDQIFPFCWKAFGKYYPSNNLSPKRLQSDCKSILRTQK